MINTTTDYLIGLFEKTNYGKLADAMSSQFYHTIHVEESFTVTNMVNNYAAGFLKANKGNPNRNRMYKSLIGLKNSTARQNLIAHAKVVYANVYTPSNMEKAYTSVAGKTKSGVSFNSDNTITFAMGEFRDRKYRHDEVGRGNFPFYTQMFAKLRAQAHKELGARMSTTHGQGRQKEEYQDDDFSPGAMVTHGYIPRGHGALYSGSKTSTVAKYGIAAAFYGLDGSMQAGSAGKELEMEFGYETMTQQGPMTDYSLILESLENALDLKYNIKYIRDEAFQHKASRRTYEIELQYADHKHNAKMKDFDKAGIKNYIEAQRRRMLSQRQIDAMARAMGKSIADVKGSPSAKEAMIGRGSHHIIQSLFKHKTKADMRLKINKRLVAEAKKVSGKETKKKTSYGKVAKKSNASTKKTIQKGRVSTKEPRVRGDAGMVVTQKAGPNPLALKELLNKALPPIIARNMTAPALRYRTGRLANSVQVEGITQGPRGGNTMVETTYRKDPYETFAPGGQKYTYQRDPERLIKKSVRQAAIGIIGGRFAVGVN